MFESDNISDTCGRSNPEIFWYDVVTKIGASIYFANLIIAADRRQIASVLLGLISSLLACMQLSVALLKAEIRYARTLSTGQNGWQKQLKRVGKQCRPWRFWVRPGRTSAWWDNFVNPQWIRSESEYVWTGEFDINTLWSHNVWTRIFFIAGKKKLRIQKYPDTCGRGLSESLEFYLNIKKAADHWSDARWQLVVETSLTHLDLL